MAATAPDASRRRALARSLVTAVGLVAAWQVVFGLLVTVGGDGSAALAYVVPPLLALLVPAVWMTRCGWWGRPWVARLPGASVMALVLPLLLVDLLMVNGAGTPPGVLVLLGFFVTGASEELLARGVVQELLAALRPVPQVLLTGGLLAAGYAVTLSVLGAATPQVLYIAGMVLCFGVAHAALRRRGVPVLVLAVLGGLVVWPQFARDAFDPLTLVASVVALGFGVWATADEPAELRTARLVV